MPITSSRERCSHFPGAPVLSQPYEAGEMPTTSSKRTSISIPVAPILSQPFETGDMPILGSNGARTMYKIAKITGSVSLPSARESFFMGPYHDFYTVVSCSRVPEEPKLFSISSFIFKELPSTRDGRCHNFHTRDFLIIINGKVAFLQYFASHCDVSVVSNSE